MNQASIICHDIDRTLIIFKPMFLYTCLTLAYLRGLRGLTPPSHCYTATVTAYVLGMRCSGMHCSWSTPQLECRIARATRTRNKST
jgi:hypothetical protein